MNSVKESEFRIISKNFHKPYKARKWNIKKVAAYKSVLLQNCSEYFHIWISNTVNFVCTTEKSTLQALLSIPSETFNDMEI